jgi:C4-dicarboxylate-specific signal transduction histidine kinase
VGFADYLAEFSEVPRIREPLLVIQQEAERAALIVKNLLGFARKQEHRRRPTSMRLLLEATLTLLRNQLMAVGVEAELSCDPDVPELDLDPVQIQQVFVNLINNAAQAIASTGRPGTIRIQARRWLGGVSVTVADDGPGMDESLAARAFEPFFTTKSEGEGTEARSLDQPGDREGTPGDDRSVHPTGRVPPSPSNCPLDQRLHRRQPRKLLRLQFVS